MGTSKKWTLYCHTHIDSGRRYIGQTCKTMMQRWNRHVYNAVKRGDHTHFACAIRKYGKDAFSHEVLEICLDPEISNTAERSWIEFYGTTNPEKGFNLAKGGDHVALDANDVDHRLRVSLGVRASLQDPVVQTNRAAASRAMWQDPEFAKKVTRGIEKAWKDPAYQAKMSAISREVNARPEVKAKISEAASVQPKSSRFHGVCWNKALGQWRAFLRVQGKMTNLGHFKEEELAARAYDQKASECLGTSARLNFPE